MRKVDLTNVQEAGSYERLPAGCYECKIIKVEDVADKEYLKIYFDITNGEHKGWFKKQYDADTRAEKQWGGSFIRSYKESALPFLKGFVTACENSNKGFTWNGADEQQFAKKNVGLVIGYEEYINKNGKKRERMSIEPHSIDKIKSGEIPVPELKKLDPSKEVQTVKSEFVDPFSDNAVSTEATTPVENDPFANSDENPFD